MINRHEECEPQVFRVGDIVEAQISFIVIPVKGGRRKMLTVLRSLALIKGNVTSVSATLLIRPSMQLTRNKAHQQTSRRCGGHEGKSNED